MTEETQKEKPQDGLALVIGGLFILALVFAAYNYFSSNKSEDQSPRFEEQEQIVDEEEGDLNGDGAKDERTQDPEKATLADNKTQPKTDSTTVSNGQATTEWTANNYGSGDIKGGSYTVKTGDTLWEIAEGAYGNGAEWTRILSANSSSVGFLANGQQALIVPGQILVLP